MDGKASWTISRQKQRKVPNQKVAKSQYVLVLVLYKGFALVYLNRDNRFHSKNNTNKLQLLLSSAFLY